MRGKTRLFPVALGALLILMQPAQAVRVSTVYTAEVNLPGGANGLRRAFDAALEQVLVKVSGLESLGNAAARRSLVPDAGQLVRQYSQLPENRVRVEFDGTQLVRILDNAGQPVWGTDRPQIAVWYAIDSGGGQRAILSGEGVPRGSVRNSRDPQAALRDQLNASAEARGLPIVLPLLDAEDLGQVSFADIWGNFSDRVLQASQRYGADAVLLGRARSNSPNDRRVRWTLVTRTEQFAWEGNAAEGPARAAEWLSQRLATYADASDALRLVVGGVDSLDRFGQLTKYLRSLNVVQGAQVVRVQDDRIEFELLVRGDAKRLSRTLDSGRLLQPATVAESAWQGGRMPDLTYNWAAGR